ncbi:MAG: GAF domain-containing protein [Vicinamibacterales bacterium]
MSACSGRPLDALARCCWSTTRVACAGARRRNSAAFAGRRRADRRHRDRPAGRLRAGMAAYHNRQVIVADIATDPLWADFRAVATEHGLRACWSTPIRDAAGSVVATFAIYYWSRVIRARWSPG